MTKKYWEIETPETVEFGNYFMRCFDKAGKLQFGVKMDGKFIVKFVLDRGALFADDQAASYLRGTLDEWEEMLEEQGDGN
ncbi:hypothetical protein [Cohnella thailandensis]|uniref:Uncharacterized protein n=1 Tax=Cohnella thailandensis TaxID=557557 RepID=A0A841SJT7_9BACL|nr:hypothetical protein [Cohnella thailandensis]MBB6632783.1 hypothetical protein [Cohnella thailandensis]MBP1975527.1 hypothetical protein [Cohnella thailandensis]